MKNTAMDCDRARRLIERLFVHRDPALFPRVHAHIGECDECREVYNSLFDAEAALGQVADEEPRVLCAPEKVLLRSVVMSRSVSRRSKRRGLLISLVAVAAASAAAVTFFVMPGDHERERDRFMRRDLRRCAGARGHPHVLSVDDLARGGAGPPGQHGAVTWGDAGLRCA